MTHAGIHVVRSASTYYLWDFPFNTSGKSGWVTLNTIRLWPLTLTLTGHAYEVIDLWPLHDPFQAIFYAKWMSDSQYAPNITLESSGTRKKKLYEVSEGKSLPHLTPVNLGWHLKDLQHVYIHVVGKDNDERKLQAACSGKTRIAFLAWHDLVLATGVIVTCFVVTDNKLQERYQADLKYGTKL